MRLKQIESEYMYRGTCIDLYKFCYKKRGWFDGHIFHASKVQDLSFSGIVGDIKAPNKINTRAAQFLIQEPDELDIAEDMMERSSNLKQLGVLKPYIAGFNTQISKVVSGYSSPSSPFLGWLDKNKPDRASPISIKVQQLIRTGFLAIEMIWSKGSTCDDLAYAATYRMIDDRLKINPLCTRKRMPEENDKMPLRRAFGKMIRDRIYQAWHDAELLDFIVLLGSPAAREVGDVLGHPVLLLPSEREILYHKYDRKVLTVDQKRWLQNNVRPVWHWKETAKYLDKTFEKIIDFQVEQEKKIIERKRAEGKEQADEGEQKAEGFTRDFTGALHFASVSTAHYPKHFKDTVKDEWTVNIKGRVDSQLKKVLPRLLTKRYNAKYVAPRVFAPPPQ